MLKTAMLAFAALLAIAGVAPAGAATVRFSGFSNGSVTAHVSTPISPVAVGRYAGFLDGNSFYSFCIDLFHMLNFGTLYSNEYVPVAAASYLGNARAADLGRLASGFLGSLNNTTTTAAFQLAVWEIAHESSGSYSLSGGGFTASGSGAAAAIAQADLWLGSLPGAGTWQATVLDSPTHQDVVTFSQAPLPGALLLLLSGIAGLGAVSRLRRRV